MDRLPYLFEGTRVQQVSSYDRSGWFNDGFDGTYSFLYIDDNGEYVLFDEMGAGCLYRFWMTYGSSPADYADYRLRFYFDNNSTPILDMSVADFFDGVDAPLEFPLVGPFNKSSHGCYSYLPFPYRERLKVTLSGQPHFYAMTYHRYDSADGLESWTGDEDQSAVMALWNAVGNDPKTTSSNLVESGSLSIAAGTTGLLFSVEGKGAVQSIRMDPAPATPDILSNVRIQMNWDGGAQEVDVPLGDFFGSGKHEIDVLSLPIGMQTSGDWYCYFSMPYWESAEICLVHSGSNHLESVPFTVEYTTNSYSRALAGHFYAQFHEESFGDNGNDFLILSEQGRGHVVGLSLFMESSGAGGTGDMSYLEGDERVYVDGAGSPCIHGTGTEDYFNAGWYFNMGSFCRPCHGNPWQSHNNTGGTNFTQAYRFHLSDIIPFYRSVDFGIEHGDLNHAPGTYSSVAYYYKSADIPSSGMELLTDLDVDDAWAGDLYDYQIPTSAVAISRSQTYAGSYAGYYARQLTGRDPDAAIDDDGYSFLDSISAFDVPVTTNHTGLLIRRRVDKGAGLQSADVFVDDVYAGTWYDPDESFMKSLVVNRWIDSEFMVASSLIAGKSKVRVSIVPLSVEEPWNEFRYLVYGINKMGFGADSDRDGLPDRWELQYVNSLEDLDSEQDLDGDTFSDGAEYTAGTVPSAAESFPAIISSVGAVAIDTEIGCLYAVDQSSDLMSNDWRTLRTSIPGTGSKVDVPIDAAPAQSFFRFSVTR